MNFVEDEPLLDELLELLPLLLELEADELLELPGLPEPPVLVEPLVLGPALAPPQAVNIERAIAAARMPTAARFIIRIIKIPPFVMVIGSFPKMSCRLTPSYPPGNPVSIAF